MTAIRSRRSRSVALALVASIVGLLGSGALAYAGWRTLSTSQAGRRVTVDEYVAANQRLPFTPAAVIGTAAEDGRLTSVVVATIEPDGTGGSIVALSPSADTNLGLGDELRPLAATYAVEGPDAFLGGVANLTTMSFDVVEIVEAERFAELVTPLGELPVDLPADVVDEASGDEWAAGSERYSPLEAARIVTASSTQLADWYADPGRDAVWAAVADRVGAGIGTADPVDSDEELPDITDLDDFLDHLFAGPVDFRRLAVEAYTDADLESRLTADLRGAFGAGSVDGVVVHSRGEAALVFATIAPGRIGSPREGARYRVLWGFAPDDLEPLGINGADATIQAINRLLYIGGNVVSVARIDVSTVPERTQVAVPAADVVPELEQGYTDMFGPTDLTARQIDIAGVDIEITLGREFLTLLDPDSLGFGGEASEGGGAPTSAPPSVPPTTPGSTPGTTTETTTETTAGSDDDD